VRFLRAVTFAILAVVTSGLGYLAAAVGLLLDPGRGRITHAVARLWARGILAMCGARLVVTGPARFEPGEPRVVAATHASYLDIPALFVAFDGQLRFVARHTLVWIPFIGWFIVLGGHFPIRRDDPRQAMDLVSRVASRMRRHRLSAVLFPEGTRTRDGRLQPLKPGALQLPLEVGVAVQPVVLLGTREIMPKGAWFPQRSGTIEVRVGPPIASAGRSGPTGRRELAADVEAAFLALGAPPPLAPRAPETAS
jgi:1-acyl-sn-glycerol-3-phosphate acyltransferase